MGVKDIWRAGRPAIALAVLGGVLVACTSGGEPPAAVGDTTAPPSSTAPPTTVDPCPDPDVAIAMEFADAAMGLRTARLTMTNCGTQPYTVEGYPEVTLLDDEQQPFDVEVLHGPEPITPNDGYCTATGRFDDGPQPVTLAPGERATAGVVWRNLTTDELDLLVDASHLSVAPTAGQAAQVIPADGTIDLGTTGRLGVGAWRPETTGTVCS